MAQPNTSKHNFEVGDKVVSFRPTFRCPRIAHHTIAKVAARSVWTDDGRRWATSEWVSDSWSVLGTLYRKPGDASECIRLAE